jgi:hypothetical protein
MINNVCMRPRLTASLAVLEFAQLASAWNQNAAIKIPAFKRIPA